jgi:hypothetical protein
VTTLKFLIVNGFTIILSPVELIANFTVKFALCFRQIWVDKDPSVPLGIRLLQAFRVRQESSSCLGISEFDTDWTWFTILPDGTESENTLDIMVLHFHVWFLVAKFTSGLTV